MYFRKLMIGLMLAMVFGASGCFHHRCCVREPACCCCPCECGCNKVDTCADCHGDE